MNETMVNQGNFIGWREKAAYALVFLFPIAINSVRGWASYIFSFLCLLALASMRGKFASLEKSEKLLLGAFFLLFVEFMIANLVNGWGDEQTRAFAMEVRYLFFIPIYLMVARMENTLAWLIRGSVLASFVAFAQVIYDLVYLNIPQATGIYSHGLLGMCALWAALLSLYARPAFAWLGKFSWMALIAIPLAVTAALLAVIYSGSRAGYLTFIVMAVGFLVIRFKGRQLAAAAIVVIIGFAISYHSVDTVSKRVDRAVHEVKAYFKMEDPVANQDVIGSVGHRFEMWRAALILFRENPVWGIGRWNYETRVQELVERGVVHQSGVRHHHVHNAYLEILMSEGSIGFILFIFILFFPLYWFIRSYKSSPETATLGILFIIGLLVYSLTDASPFIKGNFLATFLIHLAVLYSAHMQKVTAHDHGGGSK